MLERPTVLELAERLGVAGRARRRPLRPRDRRRRPGRARRRGLRRLGGPAHGDGRARGARRPGRAVEPDRELPRLPGRASAAPTSRAARPTRRAGSAPSCSTVQDAVGAARRGRRADRRAQRRRHARARTACSSPPASPTASSTRPASPSFTGAGIYYGAALTEARSCADQHVVVIGGANSAGQAAVYFSGYAGQVTMLVRGDSLEQSMSHYLIEQIAALPERRGAHAARRRSRPRATTATCARCASATPTATEPTRTSTPCFVFIGAAPRTDWLDGRRRARRARLHPRRRRRAGRGLAAEARPVPARDERARRVRRRRRARALDQARRERGRRGLDGRLAHPPVPGRRMSRSTTVADLRAVDLFDDLDDDAARRVGRGRREPRTSRRASCCAEQGVDAPGLLLLLEGDGADAASSTAAAPSRSGRHVAPTWMGAIAVAHRGPLGVAHVGRASPCRARAHPAPSDFRRLALAHPSVHRPRDARRSAPVMTPHHARSSRTASGSRRSGTMAAGLAHELNNPAAAARARRGAAWPRRSRSISATIGRFVEAGIERERGRAARRAPARGARRAPSARTALDALDAADAEDDVLDAPRGPRRRRGLAPRRAARRRRRRRRPGSTAWPTLAGPATDAALRWVGGVAHRARPRRRAAGVDRADVRPRRARSRPTPTWTAASSSRSTSTRASRRRSIVLGHKLKHTRDRGRARLRPHAAEADRARLRAQPGVDEPARQRDRRARRARHDHDRDARATAAASRVDIADDGPGIPDDARDARLRPVLHHQGRRAGHRPRASPPRGGSSIDRHDGSLAFDSEPGRHDLPRLAAPANRARGPHGRPAPTSTTSRSPSCREAVAGCEDCLRDRRRAGCTCASA